MLYNKHGLKGRLRLKEAANARNDTNAKDAPDRPVAGQNGRQDSDEDGGPEPGADARVP